MSRRSLVTALLAVGFLPACASGPCASGHDCSFGGDTVELDVTMSLAEPEDEVPGTGWVLLWRYRLDPNDSGDSGHREGCAFSDTFAITGPQTVVRVVAPDPGTLGPSDAFEVRSRVFVDENDNQCWDPGELCGTEVLPKSASQTAVPQVLSRAGCD